jgi:tripeptidyl-peptidase I
MLWFSLSVLVAVPLAHAKPLLPRWGDMKVKHEWATVPANWESIGNAPEGTTIDLRIKLKSSDPDALVKTLYEVSDPSHSRFVSIVSVDLDTN